MTFFSFLCVNLFWYENDPEPGCNMMAVEMIFQVLTFLRPVFQRPEGPPQASARVDDYMAKWGNSEINILLFWILIITTGIISMYWLMTLSVSVVIRTNNDFETAVISMTEPLGSTFTFLKTWNFLSIQTIIWTVLCQVNLCWDHFWEIYRWCVFLPWRVKGYLILNPYTARGGIYCIFASTGLIGVWHCERVGAKFCLQISLGGGSTDAF